MPIAATELSPKALEQLRARNPGKLPEARTPVAPAPRPPAPTRPGPRTASPGPGRAPSRRRRQGSASARATRQVTQPIGRASISAAGMVIWFLSATLGIVAISILLKSAGAVTAITGGVSTSIKRLADPGDPVAGNPFAARS